MSPQRRTALVSICAAGVLVALKLGTGIASGSLGLVSEALHSGTDLVAALLTFFAIGVAGRPADGRGRPAGAGGRPEGVGGGPAGAGPAGPPAGVPTPGERPGAGNPGRGNPGSGRAGGAGRP